MNALTEVSTIPGTKAELRYLVRLSEADSFELGLVDVGICGAKEIEVCNVEDKFSFVGAGIGNNIENTKDLKVMNY